MSTTIGRVDFIAGIDGTLIPSEARRLGDRLGAALGESAAKRAGRQFQSDLGGAFDPDSAGARLGRRLADSLGAAFSGRFQSALGDAGARLRKAIDMGPVLEDIGELRDVTERAGNAMVVFERRTTEAGESLGDAADQATTFRVNTEGAARATRAFNGRDSLFRRVGLSLRGMAHDMSEARREGFALSGVFQRITSTVGNGLTRAFNGANGAIIDHGGHVRTLGDRWKSLSANTRQWTLIVGIVIASMQELAVLGSAAGAGLLVLGGALTGAAVGMGALIAAFFPFVGALEDVPAELKSSRVAFDRFTASAKKMQRALSVAVFQDTEDVWDSFAATTEGLIPSFKVLGGYIKTTLRNLSNGIKPGTRGFELLQGLVEKSGPIFQRLMGVIGLFGSTLLEAFNSPRFQKSIDQLLGYLEKLFTRFDDFVKSPGFDEWLEHAEDVFGAFGGLLDSVGRVLNDMVTDESVERLTGFLDSISNFIAGPGKDVLDFFGELNLFGLLAQILEDLGAALEPLGGPMIALAEGIRKVVESGIDTLAPFIGDVATALAPFVQHLADFMNEDPNLIAGGLLAIAAAFVIFKGTQGIAGAAGAVQGFITKMDLAMKKMPGWKVGFAGLAAGILASLKTLVTDEEVGLDTFGSNVITALTLGFLGSGGNPFVAVVAGLAAFAVTALKDAFDGGGYALDAFKSEGTGNWIDTIVVGWSESLLGMKTNIQTWSEEVSLGWSGFLLGLQSDVQTKTGEISLGWSGFLLGMQADVQTKTGEISLGWSGFLHDMQADITTWWVEVQNGWTRFWLFLGGIVQTGITVVSTAFSIGLAVIGQIVSGTWLNIHNTFATAFNILRTVVSTGFATIQSTFTIALAVIGGTWNRFWSGLATAVNIAVAAIRGPVNTIIGIINGLIGKVNSVTSNFGIPGIPSIPRLAAGGIAWQSMIANIGEDGPEMVVPLRRPLGMIPDSRVRAVAAFAQGKSGDGGGGKIVNIEKGAIQIVGPDARMAAIETVDEIVERAAD